MAQQPKAHAKPPAKIQAVYKAYQKSQEQTLSREHAVIQFPEATERLSLTPSPRLPREIDDIFDVFLGKQRPPDESESDANGQARNVYAVSGIPGLFIYPNLFPPPLQLALLDKLLHRDIANSQHRTNVHLHHTVPYPEHGQSYFSSTASTLQFYPRDPAVHRPLNMEQFLNKKLRWATLGGQYDWTEKVYPSEAPPAFPHDIKRLIEGLFPLKAEAAIVNIYSPGDTLSLHRDVSEECNRPLVSVSLGVDAIFVCGLEPESEDAEPAIAVLRLRSGDAVLMSGQSRYAWHGVPKVIHSTCPQWMTSWPAASGELGEFETWRDWMKGKRINLNVRQMFEECPSN